MKQDTIEPTAHSTELSVEYWRERFQVVFGRFNSMAELATELGMREDDFAGLPGYRRLDNVKRGIAGLQITAKAVRLMEQLRPEKPKKTTYLGRQKLRNLQ